MSHVDWQTLLGHLAERTTAEQTVGLQTVAESLGWTSSRLRNAMAAAPNGTLQFSPDAVCITRRGRSVVRALHKMG